MHVFYASSSLRGLYFSFISCSSSFVNVRLSFFSFWTLALSEFCSSVGTTSRITSTSPSLMSYLMWAFPYLPLAVPVMFTSVFLASSIVISCMILTRSALNNDPLRFPFLYFFSSALDISLIFPLFDPTSSSSG